MLAAGELSPTRYRFVVWRPHEIPDEIELMRIALAGKNGLPNQHLTKYTAGVISVNPRNESRQAQPLTHPTPHTSMAVVYCRRWSSSSGGRYHRVTTRPV